MAGRLITGNYGSGSCKALPQQRAWFGNFQGPQTASEASNPGRFGTADSTPVKVCLHSRSMRRGGLAVQIFLQEAFGVSHQVSWRPPRVEA